MLRVRSRILLTKKSPWSEVFMTQEYLPLAVLFILSIVLAFLVAGLGHLFGPKRPTPRKSAPYESGMKPIGPGTRRISIRTLA